jgi:hypothetical protein
VVDPNFGKRFRGVAIPVPPMAAEIPAASTTTAR